MWAARLRMFRAYRVAVAAALATLFVGTAPATTPASSSEAAAPSLQVVQATDHVTLTARGDRVRLDLGVYIAATGGAFRINLSKTDYRDPWRVAQVDAGTGATLRELDPALAQNLRGLGRFTSVVVRDRSGDIVARRRVPFCPNGWDRQRVNDEGPQQPTYPDSCGGGFPFLKGTVWGIDHGWAKGAFSSGYGGGGPRVALAAGRYSVTVSIAPAYAALFDVPPQHRKAVVDVTVKPGRRRHRPHGDEHAAAAPWRGPQTNVPTVEEPDPSTLPDLVALPAWSVSLDQRRGRDLLGFASTPWNAGPAPLVVEGFRRPGEDRMDAYQYFSDATGEVVGRAPSGKMEYHAKRGHNHWHWLQFARFDLLDGSKEDAVRSRKQAFCIIPTDAVDLTLDRADLSPWSGGDDGTVCGGRKSLWVREVLPAGWGDTYYQSVAGQSFDVTGLPNGTYFIRIHVDPMGKLHQRTTGNDIALRRVYLRGQPGNRRVRVAPWRGVDA